MSKTPRGYDEICLDKTASLLERETALLREWKNAIVKARTLETQRNEARAENVILLGYANRVQEMALTVSTVIQQRENALEKLENAEEERDEARAEVERLRKAITDVLPGMKCQQPPKLGAWNWPWAVETLETALQPDLTGWRPADAPEKLERKGGEG